MTPDTSRNQGSVLSSLRSPPHVNADSASTQTMITWENAAERPRRTACGMVPRTAMMKAAIMVFECPGSKPCRAPNSKAMGNSVGHRVELLCHVEAGCSLFDHGDDLVEVARRSFQALDDVGMAGVDGAHGWARINRWDLTTSYHRG